MWCRWCRYRWVWVFMIINIDGIPGSVFQNMIIAVQVSSLPAKATILQLLTDIMTLGWLGGWRKNDSTSYDVIDVPRGLGTRGWRRVSAFYIDSLWHNAASYRPSSSSPLLITYAHWHIPSIGGTIFTNQLRTNLAIYAPGLPPALTTALEQSVSTLSSLDPSLRVPVLKAYVKSVDRTFLIGVPTGALASISATYDFDALCVTCFLGELMIFFFHEYRMIRNLSVKEQSKFKAESPTEPKILWWVGWHQRNAILLPSGLPMFRSFL